jgi:L-threonylcarbamoyladenylate synthase
VSLIIDPTTENLERVAQALMNGALVGLPTETVYGLAADAENEIAVKRIYEVKGRPLNHPLIVHIASLEYLEKWAIDIPNYALELAEKFWPGPMTLIFRRSEIAKNFITGGQESVAIRLPRNEVALSVLRRFHKLGGNGLAAPSANKFGAVSPTDAISVEEDLGLILNKNTDFILNGGQSEVGVESTIIDCFSGKMPKILRRGFVTQKNIEELTRIRVIQNLSEEQTSYPGGLKNHYSPKAKVILGGAPTKGDGFIALSSIETPNGCIRLSNPKDNIEFAHGLYLALREGDKKGLSRIYIAIPSGDEIALVIEERVKKASQKK